MADNTSITLKCSVKMWQKTTLQLHFNPSPLMFAEKLVISLNNIQAASRENPLRPLNLHLYSSFLNTLTQYGGKHYDSCRAPLKKHCVGK